MDIEREGRGGDGLCGVTVNFGDYNGYSTSGTISTGNWNSGNVGSPSTTAIPTSATSPYSSQTVTLTVWDSGNNSTTPYYTSTPAPCLTFSCGNLTVTSTSGTNTSIDPYMEFNVTSSIDNGPGQALPSGATMSITITPPSGSTYTYSQTLPANGYPSTATTGNIGPTNATGQYAVTWNLTSPYALATACKGTFNVVNLPYLQVYGGDTMIGSSPDYSTSTCDQNDAAGIYSWNRGSPDYSGAGDQFAVQALGLINGYASAQSSSNSPTGLSLANSPSGTNGSSGTGLASSDCNFTSDISSPSQTGLQVSSELPSAPFSGTTTYYAKGDVYISNNIIYNTSGWTNVSDIPYFKLIVVGGNIYIGSNVTELDGLYVAEPTDINGTITGGTIYTCATDPGGLSSPYYYNPSGTNAISNYYSTCSKNKLTIYGSFVAQQVEFLRTSGTLGQASGDTLVNNHAAEVFDYTPEMWLPRDNSSPSDSYTAITGLPPEL